MDSKKNAERCYSRFMWEGILKSVLAGLAVGFALNFITAFVTWFTAFSGFWLAIALLAVGTAASAPVFYFRLFRPTVMSNARRMDRYGLEERAITMVELQGDTSYLAQRQREDATEKLASVRASQIHFIIPKRLIILAVVAAVLGTAMTAVNGLAEKGILPGGRDFVDNITPAPPPVYVEVTYMVNEGGVIEGDEAQVIPLGGSTTEVIAVPDEGYAFDSWDDGGRRPTRSDSNVTESVVYTAIFLPLGDNGLGDNDGDQEGAGDQPGDKPGKEGGEGNNPNGPPSGGAGGQYLECNQVIDGETYYGSVYDEYYENVNAALMENMEMASDIKSFVSNYFKIIQVSDPNAEEDE